MDTTTLFFLHLLTLPLIGALTNVVGRQSARLPQTVVESIRILLLLNVLVAFALSAFAAYYHFVASVPIAAMLAAAYAFTVAKVEEYSFTPSPQ